MIEVQAPDGSSVSFPEGTPTETITQVMAKQFGGPAAGASAPGAPVGANDVVRATATGIPIVGGLLNKLDAATNATLAPVVEPFLEKGPNTLDQPTWSERYTKSLALQNAQDKQFASEHPIVNTGAELAGGLAATAPVAATKLGATALGLAGKSLTGMATRGAASGAAISAADAAARDQDIGNAAGIGGLVGAVAPAAGRAIGGVISGARNLLPAKAVPQNIVDVAGAKVPLSSGQATGDAMTQMMENTALRGGEGQAPQQVAEQFFRGEQAPAVEQARSNIGQGLDRFGANIVNDPQEAGSLIGEQVARARDAAKQDYKGLYDQAMSLPGEIHAGAFEGIAQKIKGDLTLSRDPVIIDDVTTPVASKALQQIENNIDRLKVQNRADPFGAPNPQDVVGINLAGVDQTRKQLISMAAATERGSADRRAVGRVIDGFDNHVDNAISNGLFSGDPRALDALRDARAAYSQYRKNFTSQGAGDDVGRVMEMIAGRNGGQGATPTEVANYLYGNANVGGTGLSVRLAQRLQNVLGADSPEWSAVRQGLWSRLTQATEGRTEMGPQKASERIYEFLNGSGKALGQVLFSPTERAQMGQYAGLLKQLVPKPGTVNYSNTAPVLRMLAANALKGVTVALGAEMGGPVGAIAGMGLNAAGKSLGERSAAGRVARSLYGDTTPLAADEAVRRRAAMVAAVAARGSQPALSQSRR